MDSGLYLVTLVGTALVLAAAFSSLFARRFGAPLLLVFLAIGLVAGEDGLGIVFDDARFAFFVGSLALAVILFDAGFSTSLAAFRQAAAPAAVLSTLGVVLTALFFAIAAYLITDLGIVESLVLGAVISSTDAAAVFFLLRAGGINLREKVRTTLEIESGVNDPIAIFLTLTLVSVAAASEQLNAGRLVLDVILGFLQQMGIGAAVGVLGGGLIARLTDRLRLDVGLVPIFVLALSLLVFGIAGSLGGSGFLAVYLAGLISGNAVTRSAANLRRFQDGISWLAQIIMFLVLGLFATPSQFPSILPASIALGLVLVFIARPLAISITLWPFRFSPTETAFISWVGLRGAVSILLALTPIIAGLDQGRVLFNMAFIVVLVSLILQGWTIGSLARRLGLTVPPRPGPLQKVELTLPGTANHELIAYRVAAGSPVVRGERVPRWARPALVVRDGRSMNAQYAGRLQEDDYVYIFMPKRYPALLDRLFTSRTALSPDDAEFFGTFAIEPDHPARELAASYSLGLEEADLDKTVAGLILERLGGHAEYGDRVPMGEVELIVRDTDEEGHITQIGLALELSAAPPSVPMYLRLGELLGRAAQRATALVRRKPPEAAADPSPEPRDPAP